MGILDEIQIDGKAGTVHIGLFAAPLDRAGAGAFY